MPEPGGPDGGGSPRCRAPAPLRPESPPSVGSSLDELAERLAVPSPPPSSGTLPPALADNSNYTVLRELGRGGMGVVYLAENTLMGRKEVLKVVSSHLLNRKGVLERFLREIRAAAQLHHPNIVTAYAASRTGDSLVLSMEYVEGFDLAELLEQSGPLSVTTRAISSIRPRSGSSTPTNREWCIATSSPAT